MRRTPSAMPLSKAITLFDENVKALAQAAKVGDPRGISRVLGLTAYLRRNLSAQQLLSLAGVLLPGAGADDKAFFSKVLGGEGKWGAALAGEPVTLSAVSASGVVDSSAARVYLHVLAVGCAMRKGAHAIASQGALHLLSMLQKEETVIKGFRPRVYQMLALCYEKLGTSAALRPQLVRAYGLASVKHDSQSQAVLLNLLLRNYIKAGLIEPAEKFIKNANAVEKMADSAVSVNQQARFLYYWGELLCDVSALLPSASSRAWRLLAKLTRAFLNAFVERSCRCRCRHRPRTRRCRARPPLRTSRLLGPLYITQAKSVQSSSTTTRPTQACHRLSARRPRVPAARFASQSSSCRALCRCSWVG